MHVTIVTVVFSRVMLHIRLFKTTAAKYICRNILHVISHDEVQRKPRATSIMSALNISVI